MASLAEEIAAEMSHWPEVLAIAQGGSYATGHADSHSDIDLYVYVDSEAPIALREAMIRSRSDRFEINNQVWEPGDEWIESATEMPVDVMYR